MIKNYENKEIDLEKNEVKKIPSKKTLTEILRPNIEAFWQTPEKVKIEFLQLVSRNPALKEADPTSLVLGIAQVLQLKISLDPASGEAALIPYRQGLKSVAQLQIMWKGLRRILLRDAEVDDLVSIEVKKGDIETLNPITGELVLAKEFYDFSFENQLKRKENETIGYASLILLDEKKYKQKSFGVFMSLNEIKNWKLEYGSKTKINDAIYGKKTTAKKVCRDFEHKIIWKSKEAINSVLKTDAGVFTKDGIDYVEGK